jgi:hypothetical protein
MLSGGAQLRGVHHRCCKKIMLALFCLYPAKKEGCRTPLVISDIRGGGEGEGIRLSSLNLLSAVVGSIVRGNQQVMSQANRRMERHARANTSARWPCCSRPRRFVSPSRLTHPPTNPSIHPSIIERYDLNVRSGLGDKVKDEDRSKYPASRWPVELVSVKWSSLWSEVCKSGLSENPLATGSLDRNAMQCT